MNKMNLVRKINAAIWIIVAIVLMIFVYKAWSINGPYTILHFFISLGIHGGFCLVIGMITDGVIVNRFNK